MYLEVWEAVDNVKGKHITIVCPDALSAASFEGAVVDFILVGLKLDGGMDSASKSMICISMHNQDDISELHGSLGTCIHEG